MIKKKKETGIEIDLTGPEGNAYNLIGLAETLSKKLNMNGAEIIKEMMTSDYENLVDVFDKHFGSIVTLYR